MNKKRISNFVNLILVLILLYLAYQKFVVNRPQQQIDVEQLQLIDLNGNLINWDEVRGKPIFINFWATWCGPCLLEMPSISKLYEEFQQEEIVFILANTENRQAVIEYEQKKKSQLPHYVVQNAGTIPIKTIPLTYLINAEGKVEKVVNRTKNWNSAQSKQMINNLIDNK